MAATLDLGEEINVHILSHKLEHPPRNVFPELGSLREEKMASFL